jgi:hypothetical protein
VGDRWAELLRRCIAEGALELDPGTAEMLMAELEGRS